MPKYNPDKKYLDSYWNLFCQNESLLGKIEQASVARDEMLIKIINIEQGYLDYMHKPDTEEDELNKKNRKNHDRRHAAEIERSYDCPYKCCDKQYGSEGSMNLHIKIKHMGGNKTEREKAAKHIVWCHA
jgi:hypothetical protein